MIASVRDAVDASYYIEIVRYTHDSMIKRITPALQQSAGIPWYPNFLLSNAKMPSGGRYWTVPQTVRVSWYDF